MNKEYLPIILKKDINGFEILYEKVLVKNRRAPEQTSIKIKNEAG